MWPDKNYILFGDLHYSNYQIHSFQCATCSTISTDIFDTDKQFKVMFFTTFDPGAPIIQSRHSIAYTNPMKKYCSASFTTVCCKISTTGHE